MMGQNEKIKTITLVDRGENNTRLSRPARPVSKSSGSKSTRGEGNKQKSNNKNKK